MFYRNAIEICDLIYIMVDKNVVDDSTDRALADA